MREALRNSRRGPATRDPKPTAASVRDFGTADVRALAKVSRPARALQYSGVVGSEPTVGMTLNGKWRIDAELGAGGMAKVYAVTHRYGYRAALKMLNPALAADTDLRERFLREGYISNAVGHPGAVKVLDDDAWGDTVFLVMELLEGETLQNRRNRLGGRLPMSEVLEMAGSLLEVLGEAHKRGIVHRDIKPDNLFRTTTGETRVLDFGIAQVKHQGAKTTAGTVMGTLEFMAPEQATGDSSLIDARTDLWAVGATLYLLLSGKPPYEGESLRERIRAASQTPRSLAEVASHVPSGIVAVVDRALSIDRDARYQDANAMRMALRLAQQRLETRTPQLDSETLRAILGQGGTERMPTITPELARSLAATRQPSEPPIEPTERLEFPELFAAASARGPALALASVSASASAPTPALPPAPTPKAPGHTTHVPFEVAPESERRAVATPDGRRRPLALAVVALVIVVIVGGRAVLLRGGDAPARSAAPAPSTAQAPPPTPAVSLDEAKTPLAAAQDAGADAP